MAPKRKVVEDSDDSSDKKSKSSSEKKSKRNPKEKEPKLKVDYSEEDFSCSAKSPSGQAWNLKISTWNVSGIRAWLQKGGLSYIENEKADIMCLQEVKCTEDKLPGEIKDLPGYHCYWLAGDKPGYSGVGLLSKKRPEKVTYGIGIEEHDKEGRVITAEYPKFYLVTTYVPNAGRGLVRLDYRMEWDKVFRKYLQELDKKKPVILCGDLNVAHKEIDLANPKTNQKTAGFTKQEREGFSVLLEESIFIDSFRQLYPDLPKAYTFWSYMGNARAKNVGWRLDYFVMSAALKESLCENAIRSKIMGSDHCPVTLFMTIQE